MTIDELQTNQHYKRMMQKRKSNANLEQARALLIQNQAAFVAQLNEMSKHQTEMRKLQVESDRRFARIQIESGRRFARIEDLLEQIKAILTEHGRLLAGLPEVIRQKRLGSKRSRNAAFTAHHRLSSHLPS